MFVARRYLLSPGLSRTDRKKLKFDDNFLPRVLDRYDGAGWKTEGRTSQGSVGQKSKRFPISGNFLRLPADTGRQEGFRPNWTGELCN
jgi:hypothetical protein